MNLLTKQLDIKKIFDCLYICIYNQDYITYAH